MERIHPDYCGNGPFTTIGHKFWAQIQWEARKDENTGQALQAKA
jgi:hypothetical protein